MRYVLAISLVLSVPVFAQEQEPEPVEVTPPTPTGVDMTPDPDGTTIKDPNIPDRPEEDRAKAPKEPAHRYDKSDYPIELVERPLTLARMQAQVGLELPFMVAGGSPTFAQILHGGFGVTRDLELGLSYAAGLLLLDASDEQNSYEVGKAVSIDGMFTIVPDILAAQARLGFFFDSDLFGMSITVGIPVRVRLTKRWILFAGADLLTVKLVGLPVYVNDPGANLASVAFDAAGGETSAGSVDLSLGSAYQIRPDLAVAATFGFHWPDFEQNDQPISLWLGASWSPMRTLDLGLRVGFARLDESDSFGVAASGALRL